MNKLSDCVYMCVNVCEYIHACMCPCIHMSIYAGACVCYVSGLGGDDC
jgi:hypothetical protein